MNSASLITSSEADVVMRDEPGSATDQSADPAIGAVRVSQRRVTLHLTAQATVEFTADDLWPMHGDYARFGIDLDSFAHEVTRRLRADGFVGYRLADQRITVIPFSAIKRIDFSES